MQRIDVKKLSLQPFKILEEDWALLVAGKERPNPMTVGWGGLGTMWSRPVVSIFVRPTRHSFGLLNRHPEFTLNFLPESMRSALDYCGSASGRDADKWTAARLGKVTSETVKVPRVAEARLAFECRIISSWDMDPNRFLDPSIMSEYPLRDFHRVFVGQVLAAFSL